MRSTDGLREIENRGPHYRIAGSTQMESIYIAFQAGAIKDVGVNGCQISDLLQICIHRLQGFQTGAFPCRENALAITKMEEALLWLEKRRQDRLTRGVEGEEEA